MALLGGERRLSSWGWGAGGLLEMSLAVPGFVPPGSTLLLSHRKRIWVKQNRSLRAPAMALASTEEKPRVITDVPPPGLHAVLEAFVIADLVG